MKLLLPILFLAVLVSCQTEDPAPAFIHPELRHYLEAFQTEALNHGVTVSIESIRVDFGSLQVAAGMTYHDKKMIIIDSIEWKSTQKKEELIFHELGHLLLNRHHDDTKIGEYYKSIMAGDGDANYEYKKYRDNKEYRSYYMDELFNSDTSIPNWM